MLLLFCCRCTCCCVSFCFFVRSSCFALFCFWRFFFVCLLVCFGGCLCFVYLCFVFFGLFCSGLVWFGWLAGWLVNWLVSWLIGWTVGRLVSYLLACFLWGFFLVFFLFFLVSFELTKMCVMHITHDVLYCTTLRQKLQSHLVTIYWHQADQS